MSNIQYRQDRIKQSKKNNTYQTFLKEIVSWYPLMIYKNQGLLSLYPDTPRSCPLVSTKTFEEQRDSYANQGLTYNPAISFFENVRLLHHTVQFPALFNWAGAENSDYSFGVYMSKNCYLSFTVISDCENILYSFAVKEHCSNVYNSSQVRNNNNNIYACAGIFNSSNIFYSRYIDTCSDLRFCSNMIGCHHCIMCDGLTNQSYYIHGQQLTKEEYEVKKSQILAQKDQFPQFVAQITKEGKNHGSTNSTGKFVLKSDQINNGYHALEVKNGQNLLMVGGSHLNTDMYDVFEAGAHGNHDFYGALDAGVKSEHIYNCDGIATCNTIFYSRFLENCSFCLGCIGLKNKSYCILNKQYSKEEWYQKVDEIFSQMEADGTLGQFFPASMNPFYFNDTAAYLAGDFNKEEVLQEGYLWRDEPIKVDIPEGAITINTDELSQFESRDQQGNRMIDDSVCKRVIIDEQGNAYRIIPMELDFLRKYGLPLPRNHWLERMKENFRIN